MDYNAFLLIFIIHTVLFGNFSCGINTEELSDVKKYLHERATYMDRRIYYYFEETSDDEKQFSFIYNKSQTISVDNHSAYLHLCALFDDFYLISGGKVYGLLYQDENFLLKPHSSIMNEEKITLIKSYEHKDVGFLIMASQNAYVSIFTLSKGDKDFFFVQSISGGCANVEFFTIENDLYLAIIDNDVGFLQVYKWTLSYFDRVEQILIGAASTNIVTFKNGDSQIFVIPQNLSKHATVYDFHKEKLHKIQHLEMEHPMQQIISYRFNEEIYVVILNSSAKGALYWWDGTQLIKWNTVDNAQFSQPSHVAYVDNTPFIFNIKRNELIVHTQILNNIELISNKQLEEHFANTIDIKHVLFQQKNFIFIVGTGQNFTGIIEVVDFRIKFNKIENDDNKRDALTQCLTNLEQKLYTKKKLHLIGMPQPIESHQVNATSPIFGSARTIEFTIKKYDQEVSEIKEKLVLLKNSTEAYKKNLNEQTGDNKMAFKGKIIIKGSLKGGVLKTKNIHTDYLNDRRWEPTDLLLYTKPQIITSKVFCSDLSADKIIVTKDETFKGLVQRSGNQIISGKHRFDSLTARKLFAQVINGVQMENVYLRSSKIPVSGIKHIDNMVAGSINIKLLNGKAPFDIISNLNNHYSLQSDIYVENFNFENINGVNWDELSHSLFRSGKDYVINGTLHVPTLKTTHLNAETINSIPTNNVLTTSTKQIINSMIHYNNIDVASITVQTLNDIKIEDIAYPGELIKGHVRIDKVHVTGDLNIHSGDKAKFDDSHIIGTNESDLLQIYNRKVKIMGNLHLRNLFFINNTAVYIGQKYFCLDDLKKNYWLKNTHQVIPVHFLAQNGITAVHLRSDKINNVPIASYMLNDLNDKSHTNYYFENVTITGNIVVDENLVHTPNLREISKSAVRLNGVYTITGRKEFGNKIKIAHLKADYLDDKDVFAALTKNKKYKITGTKYFETLVVKENLNSDNINTHFVNGYSLKELTQNSVYIDEPFVIETANFEHLKVDNLYTQTLNNKQFENYFNIFDEINGDTLDSVEFIGDVEIRSVQNLISINNIDTNSILKNNVKTNENVTINGNVTFRANVQIGELKATELNEIDFEVLQQRLLYKNLPQNIQARHVFNSIKCSNLNTPKINNIDVTQLISVKEKNVQNIFLKNPLHFESAKFLKSVKAILKCNLYDAHLKLQTNPLKKVDEVTVLKDAEILDNNSPLSYILKNAVVRNMNNTISAPVVFKKHILAKNVQSLQLINTINISYIYSDALMKYSNTQQVISGRKIFNNLKLEDVTVMTNMNVPEINGIKIEALGNAIIYKNLINDMVIRGRKTFFSGIQTKSLHGRSTMTNNLVSLSNLKPIPSAIFGSIEIEEDLNVYYVNNINFHDIVHKRLKLSSDTVQEASGVYYFDDLIINNNSFITTSHINDINIDDIIFDEGIQDISVKKTFTEDFRIFNNAQITNINNVVINEVYGNTIFKNENVNINGNIVLRGNSKITGNFNADKLNGISLKQLEKNTEMGVTKIKDADARKMLNEIAEQVRKNFVVIKEMPTKYLYLEKAEDLQLSIPKAIDGQAVQTKGEVMIHISATEKGSSCGLPENCSCPLQETLHVTPQLSINSFINKGSQRVFSYDDEHMTIHLITNTVSKDTKCRTNREEANNEISSLIWNTANFGNETGHFPGNFKGYVSGVEFFRTNGNTYAIIALFYDPILDTHDLEYQVIKFTKENDNAEIVQKIPAKGAWTLSVFNTAQGVVLVTGGIVDNTVQIYRFHQNEFKLLRNVFNLRYATAAGVILGEDSWIILAKKSPSLQIFKYSHDYDNYYFYQYLQVDSEVSGISVFYSTGFGKNERGDAYLSVVTKSGMFYIYFFRYIEGWQLQFNGGINDLQRLVPFNLKTQTYLFGPSADSSHLLTFTTQGLAD